MSYIYIYTHTHNMYIVLYTLDILNYFNINALLLKMLRIMRHYDCIFKKSSLCGDPVMAQW